MSKHELKIETQGTDFILTRIFNAPREKVFEAHSDCRQLKNWWGPREWPLTECKMEFRVGGRWHYCMTGPGGTQAWGLAIYEQIKPPELLAYQDCFSDKEGNINTALPTTVVRIEFLEENGHTVLKSSARYGSQEDLQKVMDMGMIDGIRQTWERLDEYLAKSQ
jgi:uncharacterized protein YndB with AHSA1/START domain